MGAGAVAPLVLTAPADAAAAQSHTTPAADSAGSDSLRDLAARIGLRFGTAVIPTDLDTPSYAAVLADQFSVVTPGNAMKWGSVEPTQGQFDWSDADALVAFAERNGQLVRGHTLLWHNQLPDWLTTGVQNGTISAGELASLLKQHIFTEVTRYRGRIWQWDVANEFFLDANPSGIDPNNFWIANCGTEIIADAFRWAHEADPHALLFFNDYNIAGEDGTNAKSDAVYAWLRQMLAQGVPIHGVGDQGHLDTQYGFPTQMAADLQRYADLGLKVAITEADVRTFVDGPTTQVPTDHLATFAQPYEFSQMLKAALAVPECISFTCWGFCDADSWIPGFFTGQGYGTIYDVNLQPKPAFYDLQQDLRLAAEGAPHRVGGSNGGFGS
ncbi:endo-1,4-beta-xylanase [Actinospica sp. MGRD01-02]|uniref:Beta-xylanase n=2 Tax=Actinospica acidithermotolerans TaxID=2828514 RepID=A0A941ECJ2_9ACTN|nr:endo-1,4-beta-xylanase [Actinospica acidithermotolerans]